MSGIDVLPPGPRLSVAAQSAAWTLRPWQFMDYCAARLGDMFTLRLIGQQPWVMVSHPDVVRQVFTGPPEVLHAGEGNRILLPVVGANSVLLLDDDAHREQRRLLMPPFRGNHLASYAETMAAVAKAEISRWPRGKAVRLHPLMQLLTLEIILRAVFGLGEGARLDALRAALVRIVIGPTATFGQLLMVLTPERVRVPAIRRFFRGIGLPGRAAADDAVRARRGAAARRSHRGAVDLPDAPQARHLPRPRVLPSRAVPRGARRDLHVDPVRRRRPPLPGCGVRRIRDAHRAQRVVR
ncbi:MAG: cytochrome P450, partial [Mycobacterium sp.]|nr:cytochrome P450 [Mycobacterium sp.]